MNEDGTLIHIFPALGQCDLTVKDMDLEVSTGNALERHEIHTLAQLLRLSHPELVQIFPNRRLRSYEDVIHRLVCLSEELEGTDGAPRFISEKDISNTLGGRNLPDKRFNIFQVAGIWKSEEIHTSVIAELINPQSRFHDKGAVFLAKFLSGIGVELSAEELKTAEVKTEASTDKDRRIDMVISTESLYLPFEVKIWAGDQDAQLQHYYEFAKAQAKKLGKKVLKIYYLTPDRHTPTEQSRGNLSDKQVCRLSFKEDILPWLEECLAECKKEPNAPSDVLEIMRQLHDNIQGQPGGQGFSQWTWGVLNDICQQLAQRYVLSWRECTDRYKIFTLHKMPLEDEDASLELALWIEREEKDSDLTSLYLICALVREGKNPAYNFNSAITKKYKSDGRFQELLEKTFLDGGVSLGLRSDPGLWDHLPAYYKKLAPEQCCCEIENILKELDPEVLDRMKRN